MPSYRLEKSGLVEKSSHSPASTMSLLIAGFFVVVMGTLFAPAPDDATRTTIAVIAAIVPLSYAVIILRFWDVLYAAKELGGKHVLRRVLATGMLTLATAQRAQAEASVERVVDSVGNSNATRSLQPRQGTMASSRNTVLWVDDHPDNNRYERQTLRILLGIRFTLVRSTEEAMAALKDRQFAAIISDFARQEGADEGYVLLDRVRGMGIDTPLFVYTSSNNPVLRSGAYPRPQGWTARPHELINMVSSALTAPDETDRKG